MLILSQSRSNNMNPQTGVKNSKKQHNNKHTRNWRHEVTNDKYYNHLAPLGSNLNKKWKNSRRTPITRGKGKIKLKTRSNRKEEREPKSLATHVNM